MTTIHDTDNADLAAWLVKGGYASLAEWADDSDYWWDERDDCWRVRGGGHPVDIEDCALDAMEAEAECIAAERREHRRNTR